MLTKSQRNAQEERKFLTQRWKSPMGMKADEITAEMPWLVSKSERTKSDDQRFFELATRLREISGSPNLIDTCLAVERFRHEGRREDWAKDEETFANALRAQREAEEAFDRLPAPKEHEYWG